MFWGINERAVPSHSRSEIGSRVHVGRVPFLRWRLTRICHTEYEAHGDKFGHEKYLKEISNIKVLVGQIIITNHFVDLFRAFASDESTFIVSEPR